MVEAVALDGIGGGGDRRLQPRQDPALGEPELDVLVSA
jgi:hypothetical protein